MRGARTSPSPASRAATSRAPSRSRSCGWAPTRRARRHRPRGWPDLATVVAADPVARAGRGVRGALRAAAAVPAQGAGPRARRSRSRPTRGRAGAASCAPPPGTRSTWTTGPSPSCSWPSRPFEVFVGHAHATPRSPSSSARLRVPRLAELVEKAGGGRRPGPRPARRRCSPPRPTRSTTSPARSSRPACGSRPPVDDFGARRRRGPGGRGAPRRHRARRAAAHAPPAAAAGGVHRRRGRGAALLRAAGSASRSSRTPTTSCVPG